MKNLTKIRRLVLLIIPVFTLFIMFSCKEGSLQGDEMLNSSQEYNLNIGNEWNYYIKLTTINYDTLWNYQGVDSIVSTSKVKVVSYNESLYEYTNLVKLMITEGTNFGEEWYLNSSNELYRVAYSNAGAVQYVFPKKGHQKFMTDTELKKVIHYLNRDVFIGETVNDSIMKYQPKQLLLKYPLKVGDFWWLSSGNYAAIRRVDSKKQIQLNSSSVEVFVIETDIASFGIKYYDYINIKYGLQKRTMTDTLIRTSQSNPDIIGYGIFNFEVTLMNSNIN